MRTRRMDCGTWTGRFQRIKRGADHGGGKRRRPWFIEQLVPEVFRGVGSGVHTTTHTAETIYFAKIGNVARNRKGSLSESSCA